MGVASRSAARHPRLQRGGRARQSRARATAPTASCWAFPMHCRARTRARTEWVGNPLRADIVAVPPPEARFAGRDGPLQPAGRRRQPRRRGAERHACRRRWRCCPPPRARGSCTRPATRHIEALRAAYARRGVDGECVAVHRRHGGALRRRRLRDLPRRRADGRRARRGRRRRVIVPLPGAIADEQSANARFLVDAGAALAMPQARAQRRERSRELARGADRARLLAMAQRRARARAGRTRRRAGRRRLHRPRGRRR